MEHFLWDFKRLLLHYWFNLDLLIFGVKQVFLVLEMENVLSNVG